MITSFTLHGKMICINTTQKTYSTNFFFQDKLQGTFDETYETVTPLGQIFSKEIMNSSNRNTQLYGVLKKYSDLLKKNKILESSWINNIEKNFFGNMKVLGVHKRGTDHMLHGQILSDEYFFEKIDNEISSHGYEKIFLITDDETSFNNFCNRYQDKLITTNSLKTKSRAGLHISSQYNKEQLAIDVMKDAILLSQTTKKLLTQSNVAYFSVLCNFENSSYEFIDKHLKYH